MKKIRFIKTCYFLFLSFVMINCTSNKNELCQIKGNIKGLGNGKVILHDENFQPVDTVEALNDHFSIEKEFDGSDPLYQAIHIPMLGHPWKSLKRTRIFLFIDNREISISATIGDKGIENVEIQGSPTLDENNLLEENFPVAIERKKYIPLYNEAFKEYNNVEQSEENLKVLKYYSNILDSLYKQKKQNIIDAISQNNKSIALSYILYSNFRNDSLFVLKDILNRFAPEMRGKYYLAKLQDKVNAIEASAIGAIAPDFVLKDSSNNEFKLSNLRGKYVMIDFWASWCGPCRSEIPNIIAMYNQFQDKGLEILAVSTDTEKNRHKWIKALKDEKMPYKQLWDPEGITMELYQYRGIPHIILISPEGVILEKGLRGENMKIILNKYLN